MSRMFTTAGSTLEIGPEMEFDDDGDFVASDFPTTGWTVIGGVTSMGSGIGDNANPITTTHINSGRVRKAKGARNAGTIALQCDLDYADAGQLALVAAEKSNKSFSFRMTWNDAPTGGKPSQRLFVAYVMSCLEGGGEADSTLKLQSTMELDGNIVRVSAQPKAA